MPATNGQPAPALRQFKLLSVADILSIPKPGWILEDILTAGGFSVLFGPSGAGKTFIVLDWALSVATGEPWMGHKTQPGHVVYVAAEGSYGIGARIRAWIDLHHFARKPPITPADINASFITQPAQMLEASDTDALISAIAPMKPSLVIIDTLARSMVGGDENSAKDVGLFIAGCDRIREATGAAVLVIHHTGKDGRMERGSSALRGAADAMIAVSASDEVITLTCEKQKDAAPFDRLLLQLLPHADSCIVTRLSAQRPRAGISQSQRTALEALATGFPKKDGASAGAWLKVADLPDKTFYRTRTELLKRELVRQEGEKRNARYFITDEGEQVLSKA